MVSGDGERWIGFRIQESGSRNQEAGSRRQGAEAGSGIRKQEIGNRIGCGIRTQEAGGRKQETRSRKQDAGSRNQENNGTAIIFLSSSALSSRCALSTTKSPIAGAQSLTGHGSAMRSGISILIPMPNVIIRTRHMQIHLRNGKT